MIDPVHTIAIHEAAHAAVAFALGRADSDVIVQCRFTDGLHLSGYVGEFRAERAVSVDDIEVISVGSPETWAKPDKGDYLLFLPKAIIAAAGPIAQMMIGAGDHGREGDDRIIANMASLTHYATGRNPEAWTRLVHRTTRQVLRVPLVWRSVEHLADALKRGLRLEMMRAEYDGRQFVEYCVPSAESEHLLCEGGGRRGLFKIGDA
ncbi:MAG: hypothetical protein ACR652_15060 [Methylocystis sp.]|uniref:hypothetical protein n=1 Tax=Methylocystis sp. TaxID=1911079 RepID=UPI003DA56918